jgi:hypothetical protein
MRFCINPVAIRGFRFDVAFPVSNETIPNPVAMLYQRYIA